MIKADKKWWADKIFKIYLYRLLKKHFASIGHFEPFAEIDPELPTLMLPNHATWWDGFFYYFLNKEIYRQDDYLMMLESQLRKYPFFPKIGVFGIEPDNPKAALRSLQYTVELMSREKLPRTMICIFPQGELQAWNPEQVAFKQGVDWLIKKFAGPINLLPAAFRCELRDKRAPEVFFSIPQNYIIDARNFRGMTWLESISRNLMIHLEQSIRENKKAELMIAGHH